MTVNRTAHANRAFGKEKVLHAVRSGRWQRPARGVVVTHNGPLTPPEQDLVALLSGGPATALGGPTALVYDGFKGFTPEASHVVVTNGARRPSDGGAIVHWSTKLGDSDVHPSRSPRRTRPARSVCDFASWCASDRYARAIVLAAFQQRIVNVRSMRDALSRRGPCRRRTLIIESILDAKGGIQSLPELDFKVLCHRAGLPEPSRQTVKSGRNGRLYLDVEWEGFGLVVEIHGMPHIQVMDWDADVARNNEVVIGGPRLLIFTSYAIRHLRGVVTDQLTRAFASAGWSPPA